MPLTADRLAQALSDALQDLAAANLDYAEKAQHIEYDASYFLHQEGEVISRAKAKLADVLCDLKQWALEP